MEKSLSSDWSEQFTVLRESSLYPGSWDCMKVIDGADGLEIFLENELGESLVVRFASFLSYRAIDEGSALRTGSELFSKGGGTKFFYRVERSHFLKWFKEESFGIHQEVGLHHYAIYSIHQLVDVVTFAHPTFELNRVSSQ